MSRYAMRWPDTLPAGVPAASVGATEVQFIRIQETTTHLKSIVTHYRYQLGTPAEQILQDGQTLWLDSQKRVPDHAERGAPDRRRSADVVISRAKKTSYAAIDQEEKIAVDILLIEVNDPALGPQTEANHLVKRATPW